MTPFERRIMMISIIGFFVLLGVVINNRSVVENMDSQRENRKTLEFPIDINSASEKDLERLPMIGPVKAKSIVEYREKNGSFESMEDLTKVSGIGEKTLKRIKDYITISGSTTENAKESKREVKYSKINVNTATIDDLKSLPGIGEVKAKRIIENRPYKELRDLLRVPGIGRKTLEKIKDMIDF